jgi:hypothetical protein
MEVCRLSVCWLIKNGCYLFANVLNALNGLAHVWLVGIIDTARIFFMDTKGPLSQKDQGSGGHLKIVSY